MKGHLRLALAFSSNVDGVELCSPLIPADEQATSTEDGWWLVVTRRLEQGSAERSRVSAAGVDQHDDRDLFRRRE